MLPIATNLIYKVNLVKPYQKEKEFIQQFFTGKASHILEDGGKSSRTLESQLFKYPEMQELCFDVLVYADIFWVKYGLDTYYEPCFNTVWANEHRKGHRTLSHFHSGAPLVAVYYCEVPESSGRIYFENPLEYHMCHEPRCNPVVEFVDVKAGDLLIFPGFLKHGTEASGTDEPRTVIAFNFTYQNRKPISIPISH